MLDDQALITPDLLKLTRWLADYYLCGWGQVLNAVVPAEVRERAGTHNIILIELVPQTLWPNPLPTLTPKQKALLELLQTHGKPIELKTLGRLAKCGPGPIRALGRKEPGRAAKSRESKTFWTWKRTWKQTRRQEGKVTRRQARKRTRRLLVSLSPCLLVCSPRIRRSVSTVSGKSGA